MPGCGRFDTLDEFFDKAVALEVTHVENKKPQQQQQQQQQQKQKQSMDSSSKGGRGGYQPSINEPADTTGGYSGQAGSNRHGKSGGGGQLSGLPPAPWVSTEMFEGRGSTGKWL